MPPSQFNRLPEFNYCLVVHVVAIMDVASNPIAAPESLAGIIGRTEHPKRLVPQIPDSDDLVLGRADEDAGRKSQPPKRGDDDERR